MKQLSTLSISISFLFVFTIISTTPVYAQASIKNTSSVTGFFGGGSGSFTGVVQQEIAGMTASQPGTDKFTYFALGFRLLFATEMLDSRLSLGVEYDAQIIEDGGVSSTVQYVGGGDVPKPDPAIHSIQFIGDYLLISISENIKVNVGGGTGILFFAHIDTRMTFNQYMFPEVSDESTVQLAGSVRAAAAIYTSNSFSIDPELHLLVSAGKEKVFLIQLLVGLTYRW